jgi:hypothetical protein
MSDADRLEILRRSGYARQVDPLLCRDLPDLSIAKQL